MNKYDEIAMQIKQIQRTQDYHERVDLEESVCIRLEALGIPEGHPLVAAYDAATGKKSSRFSPEFDPANL